MRNIVTEHDGVIGSWVAERVNRRGEWGAYHALGIEQDGKLIAGVVFNEFVCGGRCSMHCAGEGRRWLTKQFLWMCFDYVFNQLELKVIVNTVDSDNEDSLRFTAHIGFNEVARIPDAAGDADLVIFALPKSACRWI